MLCPECGGDKVYTLATQRRDDVDARHRRCGKFDIKAKRWAIGCGFEWIEESRIVRVILPEPSTETMRKVHLEYSAYRTEYPDGIFAKKRGDESQLGLFKSKKTSHGK